jgi:hypothetical protein
LLEIMEDYGMDSAYSSKQTGMPPACSGVAVMT